MNGAYVAGISAFGQFEPGRHCPSHRQRSRVASSSRAYLHNARVSTDAADPATAKEHVGHVRERIADTDDYLDAWRQGPPITNFDVMERLRKLEVAVNNGQVILNLLVAKAEADRADINALVRNRSAEDRLNRLVAANAAYRDTLDTLLDATATGASVIRERAEAVVAVIRERQPDFDTLIEDERYGLPWASDRMDRIVASGEAFKPLFEALAEAITTHGTDSMRRRLDRMVVMADTYFTNFAALLDAHEAAERARRLEELEARVAQNRADIDAIEALAQEKISVLDRVADKCDANWEMIEMLQADGLKLHDHDEQMEQALQSSRQIGAAVGIIMATRNVSEKEAFQSLVAASQRTNTKLKSIAGRVISGAEKSPA